MNSSAAIKKPTESVDINRYLIQASSTFFVSINEDGKISFISDEALQLLGYSLEEVIGSDYIATFIPEDEQAKLRKFFSALRESKEANFIECHSIARDGQKLIVKYQWWPVFTSDNHLDFFYGLGIDITACIQAEEVLKEKEVRYRVLEENIIDVIWTVDIDLRFTYISSSIHILLGYSVEEILGNPLEWIIVPEFVESFKNILLELFVRAKDFAKDKTIELKLLHRDGSKIWTESKMKTILNSKCQPVGILGVTRDISERKKSEEEKDKIHAQLLQAHKMEAIGRLTGGVVHDFNNLLLVIIGYGDLLANELLKDSRLYEYVSEIIKAANHAVSLTRQLLAFSHKSILQSKLFDVNDLISEIQKMLKRLIGKNLTLETFFDPHYAVIKGDPTQISQVIINLAVNARDSMHEGGILTIKTENIHFDEGIQNSIPDARPGKFICITVQDTGTGIDDETMEHIFEPFFSTKKSGEGTGLGLSVAYGIIKQHQGWIEVSSEVGKGTTFKLYLPASPILIDLDAIKKDISAYRGNLEKIV